MRPELSEIVQDQIERSINAGSEMIVLDVRQNGGEYEVFVSDNGRALDEKTVSAVLEDFQSGEAPEKQVALLKRIKDLCEKAGGKFDIGSGGSENGTGTSLYMRFDSANPESPTIDLPEMFTYCMIFDGNFELVVNRFLGEKKYTAVRSEIFASFGDLNDSRSIALLTEYFDGFEEEIHGKTRS